MAHSIPPLVELKHKYNKVIKIGKSRKNVLIRGARDKSLTISEDGDFLDKPIQVYRMWYRYLQLALELEENKVHIITKMEKTPLQTPKKDAWGKLQKFKMVPVKHKVKVKRGAYEGWDIDTIATTSFDKWWEGDKGNYPAHKELFYPEKSITVIQNKNEVVINDQATYIRIDNRRRINEIEKDLRAFIQSQRQEGKMQQVESAVGFPVYGYPNINTLINRYNVLVLQLTTTKKDMEIFESGLLRITKDNMGKDDDAKYTVAETENRDSKKVVYSIGDSAGSTMRDLMLPAKLHLLAVCDGFFVKNPNKDYLKPTSS